jgi:hypothetical protein
MNKEDTDGVIRQAVITVDSNISEVDNGSIYVGAGISDTHNWEDFNNGNKIAKNQSGKVMIPVRSGTYSGINVESLIKIDKFLYKTSYGAWDQDATVVIEDSDGSIITGYKTLPRDGKVIFDSVQSGSRYIKISYQEGLKVAAKFSSFSTNQPIYVYGIGFMYTKN